MAGQAAHVAVDVTSTVRAVGATGGGGRGSRDGRVRPTLSAWLLAGMRTAQQGLPSYRGMQMTDHDAGVAHETQLAGFAVGLLVGPAAAARVRWTRPVRPAGHLQ